VLLSPIAGVHTGMGAEIATAAFGVVDHRRLVRSGGVMRPPRAGRRGVARHHLLQSVLGRASRYLLMAVVRLCGRAAPCERIPNSSERVRKDHVPADRLPRGGSGASVRSCGCLGAVRARCRRPPLRTSIDVVCFAVACMALTILVRLWGGLHLAWVSSGHGALFGLGGL